MIQRAQRDAGKVASVIHQKIADKLQPGVNLLEIESLVEAMIDKAKMSPAFKGYKGYPAATCLSVNSAVVHGIPTNYSLKEGDIIGIDFGVENDGWIVDCARTHGIGTLKPKTAALLETTKRALDEAITLCRAGRRLGDLGHQIQTVVEKAGFYIIRELTGHGVGRQLQEPPTIPNYGLPGRGPTLKPGQTIAIEPITALRPTSVTLLPDGWTVVAQDAVISAHFEDTIAITQAQPHILTRD